MISSNENIKTFVLDNEDTKQSKIIPYQISLNSPTIDMKFLLQYVHFPQKKQFTIYSAEMDTFIPFQQICIEPFMVPESYLQLQIIMIKYHDYQGKLIDDSNLSSHDVKKQRSRQRTIGDVIELIHQWRSLHQIGQNGRRINLQQAAKMVGISKKSLDDYYYQLRVGEKHEFDFNTHLNDKIGVLRAFIKQKQPQRKTKQKPAKHAKKLKIIEQFAQSFNIKQQAEMMEPQSQKQKKDSVIDQDMSEAGLFWGPAFQQINRQSLLECENDFFNGFKFQMREADDPFLMFNQRRTSDLENSSSNIFNNDL